MNNREKMLRSLSAVQFALWELHLYLDTHPGDTTAQRMHAQQQDKYMRLLHEYEEEFGPLSPAVGEGTEWLKNPWPWENEGCVS